MQSASTAEVPKSVFPKAKHTMPTLLRILSLAERAMNFAVCSRSLVRTASYVVRSKRK